MRPRSCRSSKRPAHGRFGSGGSTRSACSRWRSDASRMPSENSSTPSRPRRARRSTRRASSRVRSWWRSTRGQGRPRTREGPVVVRRLARGEEPARDGRWRARPGPARGDDEFEAHFHDALAAHVLSDDRWSLARTRLAFGERLRRAGRRVDAREPAPARPRGVRGDGSRAVDRDGRSRSCARAARRSGGGRPGRRSS